MIVDDRASDRVLARRVLRKIWPEVEISEVDDGLDAVGLLERDGEIVPDVILLDINMPRMGGYDFLEAWYADTGIDIPVVFMLTSSDLPADRERARRYPSVKNYIVKPITRETARQLSVLAS